MEKPKKKFGRPTKYKKQYCQDLIEHCSMGLSLESFSATIDCCRDTLYEWKKKHPDFFDAIKRAKEAHLIYVERRLASILNGNRGNVVAAIFMLKCKHQWKEDPIEDTNKEPIRIEIIERKTN